MVSSYPIIALQSCYSWALGFSHRRKWIKQNKISEVLKLKIAGAGQLKRATVVRHGGSIFPLS